MKQVGTALAAADDEYAELPPLVAGSVRKEPLIMATGAPRADRHGRARLTSLFSDHNAEVEKCWPIDLRPGDGEINVRSDLIAAATDGGPQVHQRFLHVQALASEFFEPTASNSDSSSLPTAVQQRAHAGWVRDEDRDAIGKRHRHRGSRRRAQMTVGPSGVAEPS